MIIITKTKNEKQSFKQYVENEIDDDGLTTYGIAYVVKEGTLSEKLFYDLIVNRLSNFETLYMHTEREEEQVKAFIEEFRRLEEREFELLTLA